MRRMTRLMFLLAALLLSLSALAQQDVISTFIGGGPNGIPAINSNLYNPEAVAVDSAGNFYVSSYYQNRIFKVTPGGTLTVFAGSGAQGFGGDGVAGGAANAYLYHPFGIAIDASNNLYFADAGNCVVRKVDTTNTIKTIAGIGGSCGFSGDGAKGTLAQLNNPNGVALDGLGNLIIADTSNCRIRKVVLANGNITTVAGTGACGYTGDTAAAINAEVYLPSGVAADAAGDIFIADSYNVVIREITKSNGKINTIAGNHSAGFSGDGAAATSAQMNQVFSLAVDSTGTTVTFPDYYNQRVRQFTVGGNINTVAGNGSAGFGGDGAAATSANLYYPEGIGFSGANFFVAEASNNRVRKFTVGGNINTVAGNGSSTLPTLVTGVPPKGVVLYYPFGVFSDTAGNFFVNDTSQYMVREWVKSSNLVNFFAGTGASGFSGDGTAATSAQLAQNYGSVKDSKGNVYIADTYNCVVRMVNTAGDISTFAGIGQHCGFIGDGGPAVSAQLNYPYAVAVDSKDNIYIADTSNHVIREVVNGTINTIAGIGQRAGYSGDGGPATAAQLYNPYGVSVDKAGNVFIADTSNCRIRKVSSGGGFISTVAGTGSCGFTGDGAAADVQLSSPYGVRVDANDNLFIADTYNEIIRWVSANGIMTTFAGNRTAGFLGDGGPALSAEFYSPTGITQDSAGNFYIADQSNFRIRKITAFPAFSVSSANLSFALTGVGTTSPPEAVTISAVGPLTITDISVTGNYSEVDNCPASMASGTACTMYVYFTPTGAGTASGAVTVSTNGLFNPVSTISLTGSGTAMSLTGGPLKFANQVVKTTSGSKSVTVTNNGSTAITMSTISLTDATNFAIASNNCPASGSKLNAGTFCTVGITFKPGTTGLFKGALVVKDSDPTSPQLTGMSGTGISSVSLTPATVTFATTAIGATSVATTITVKNNTAGSITLGTPAVTVTAPFLSTAATTCTDGLVLASNATCLIAVSFKPTAVGLVKGTVSLSDNDATSPQTAALSGIGTGVKFTPGAVNFGLVNRGTNTQTTITVKNVGTTTVYFTGAEIAGTNSADFGQSSGNPPCGGSLIAGASCTFTLTFNPSKDAAENATYKLYDNSPGSPQLLKMTGTGQN